MLNHEQVRERAAQAHKTVFGDDLGQDPRPAPPTTAFGLYAGIPALVYGPQSDDIHASTRR